MGQTSRMFFQNQAYDCYCWEVAEISVQHRAVECSPFAPLPAPRNAG